jgi:hypothetical protein
MKGLKSKIITTILDETGIRLHPRDFQITTIDHMCSLKLWGVELISKKYQSEKSLDSDEFAEDLLNELFDEYYDFREKIIEVKKEDLTNQYLETVRTEVIEFLKKNKISAEMIESLDFEFIDMAGTKGSKIADDWGFPTFGLRITDFEQVDYFYTIDVQKEPIVVDINAISTGLLKQVR